MSAKSTITSSGPGMSVITKGLEKTKSLEKNHAAICPKCGSTKMSFDETKRDDAHVICECGHNMGTKREVAEAIRDQILAKMKDNFKL